MKVVQSELIDAVRWSGKSALLYACDRGNIIHYRKHVLLELANLLLREKRLYSLIVAENKKPAIAVTDRVSIVAVQRKVCLAQWLTV